MTVESDALKVDRCPGWDQTCVDSAFGSIQCTYLIKLSEDDLVSNLHTDDDEERKVDIQRKIHIIAMRQAVDWWIRIFQGSFPRLKDRLVFEDRGEVQIAIKSFILLFNLPTQLLHEDQPDT